MITTKASRVAIAPVLLTTNVLNFLNRNLVVLHWPQDYFAGEPAAPCMPAQPGTFGPGGQ
jgi:hypothetical protein